MDTGNSSYSDLNSTWNETGVSNLEAPLLKKVHDAIILALLIIIMFSMGCLITPREIWGQVRYPVGVGIGMLSQFLALPLSAFCLVKILQVPPLQGTGVIILATCPGGTTSNVFAYMVDGDVALSVTMTTLSTLLALGMMPLNLWIYASHMSAATGGLVIPYSKIGMSLLVVTAPVGFGMLFKWKVPSWALKVSKIGSYTGLLLILLSLTLELILYPDIFSVIAWQIYFCLAVLPFISLCLGFGLSLVARQPPPVRRTVAIECSVQNVGLSITIITLSFPFQFQKSVIAFSYLYTIPLMTTMITTVLIYKFWFIRASGKNSIKRNGEVQNGQTDKDKADENASCLKTLNSTV